MTNNQFYKAAWKREIKDVSILLDLVAASYQNDYIVKNPNTSKYNGKNSFFRIKDSNKMKLGQILVQLIIKTSNSFFNYIVKTGN